MGKYEFIKTKNITPVHKVLKLEYEDGDGEIKSIDAKIYPYTVEEKLEIQNITAELNKYKEKEDFETAKKYAEELELKSVLYVLRKEDKDITEEEIKKMPSTWKESIVFKSLEFEGITKEQVEDSKK